MVNEKYYRSPIDKLVVESGFMATKIARKMGIKYHRMVALRRLKDVKDKDIKLCEQAIIALKQEPKVKSKLEKLEAKPKVTESVIKLPESVKVMPESVAFMLGQFIGLLDNLFDTLNTNNIEIPRLLERKKQLEEQCNKLLSV